MKVVLRENRLDTILRQSFTAIVHRIGILVGQPVSGCEESFVDQTIREEIDNCP
jgi:hypothetical protein